jgi:branched-chain amino acid transport system substrate-binding protein
MGLRFIGGVRYTLGAAQISFCFQKRVSMPRREIALKKPYAHLTSFAALGWVLLLCLLVVGCDGGANSNEILIGHYASLTGSQATFGSSTDNAVKLAVEEINAAGGINGKQIRLITYDDKGDAGEAGTAVMRLITKDKVVAVIGEVASKLSLAAAPVCQENGVPMLSPSSTNPDVTKVGDMIFRCCFIDPFQGSVCAKFATESPDLKAKTAAILYDQSSPYSKGLSEEFEKAFVKLGGKILAKQTFQEGDAEFSAQLTAIRSSKPDIIFVPGYYTEVGSIAVQARKLGIKTPMLGGDGWESPKLGEVAGKAFNGCFYSNHYSSQDPSPKIQEFIKKYSAQYKETPESMAALGYDATYILAEALKRSKSLSGKDIAAELAKTKDFDGVTGKITIDADRNAVKPAVILEMKDGVPTYVTTIKPGI